MLLFCWMEGNGSELIIYTLSQFHYRHLQHNWIHAKQNHVRVWFCGVDMFAHVGAWKYAYLHVFSQVKGPTFVSLDLAQSKIRDP
jgi:hypothetical protein